MTAGKKAAETRKRNAQMVADLQRSGQPLPTNFRANTLRPGLLVSLKTTITGNAEYKRLDIEADRIVEGGAKKAKWETERTINNPAEYEAATKARSMAGSAVRRVCSASAFGLLCPQDMSSQLDAAVKEARAIVEAFNASAAQTKIGVYVIVGRVAADDIEAVRAINGEVRDLIKEMENGLKNLDAGAVRAAASKARGLGNMLSPDAAARIQIAITAAREAAKRIVAAGEAAAVDVDTATMMRLAEARTAFLDLEAAGEIQAPQPEARAVDFAPAKPIGAPKPAAPAVDF